MRSGEELRNFRLVRIADNPGDAWKRGEFFWRALGVASGDDNASMGIVGVNLAYGIAGLGIGGRGDGASVDDDDVRRRSIDRGNAPPVAELAFERGAVSLGSAAAELFDVKRGHGWRPDS